MTVIYPKQNLNNLKHLAKSKCPTGNIQPSQNVPLVDTHASKTKPHNCCGEQQRAQYLSADKQTKHSRGKEERKELSLGYILLISPL